jgi:hypothetical protein
VWDVNQPLPDTRHLADFDSSGEPRQAIEGQRALQFDTLGCLEIGAQHFSV